MTTSPGMLFANNESAGTGDLDTIDLGLDNNMFDGETIFLVVHVTKKLVGTGTMQIALFQSSLPTSGFVQIDNGSFVTLSANDEGTIDSISIPNGLNKRYVKATKTVFGGLSGEFTAYLSAFPPGSVDAPLKKGVLV